MTVHVLTAILSFVLAATSAADILSAESPGEKPPEITPVLLNTKTSRYDVRLDDVPYGLSRTHVLRFTPEDFEAQTITGVRLLACKTCITTAVVAGKADSALGFYEATLVLNRYPHRTQELGDYEDAFHVLGPNNRPLAELKVRHSTVLSTRVDPNRIQLGRVTPEEVYRVRLRKNGSFRISDVRLDDSKRLRVQSWEDRGESVEALLEAAHTYEDTTVAANLIISPVSGEQITLPLNASIREFLRVRPTRLILGVVERGQIASARIVISSTSPCRILSCTSDMEQCEANTIANDTTETTLDIAFPMGAAMRNGPFRKSLQISTSLSTHPISIPVYGTLVDRQAPRETADEKAIAPTKD